MDEFLNQETFKIRAYGFGELAQEYLPRIAPASATRRLKAWIDRNRPLSHSLAETGYQKGLKTLTPAQVKLIVEYLGWP